MMKYVFGVPVLRAARSAVVALCLLLLPACASSGGAGSSSLSGHDTLSPVKQVTSEGVDALRVGELILIEFSGVEVPPPRHEERIKIDGNITLPNLAEPIRAAGKTRGELEEEIHKRYVPAYYQRLTVIVRNEGRYFYVKGQVKNPNQFMYMKEMTVLRAIATAGDFTDFAKKTQVQVTRADGRKLTVNCNKALHNPSLDVPIFPDDRIDVPRRLW
jgi:protein involved in polysaccharide export with SLBB domain